MQPLTIIRAPVRYTEMETAYKIRVSGLSKKKHGLVVIRTRDLRRVKATS
jgi:hypothetical protein